MANSTITVDEKSVFSNAITVQANGLVFSQSSFNNTITQLTNRTRWLVNEISTLTIVPTGLIYTANFMGEEPTPTNPVYETNFNNGFGIFSQVGTSTVYSTASWKILNCNIPFNSSTQNLAIEVSLDVENYPQYFGIGSPQVFSYLNFIFGIQLSTSEIYGLQSLFKPQLASMIHCDFMVGFPQLSTIVLSTTLDKNGACMNVSTSSVGVTYPSSGTITGLLLQSSCGAPTSNSSNGNNGSNNASNTNPVIGSTAPLCGAQGTVKIYNTGNNSNLY